MGSIPLGGRSGPNCICFLNWLQNLAHPPPPGTIGRSPLEGLWPGRAIPGEVEPHLLPWAGAHWQSSVPKKPRPGLVDEWSKHALANVQNRLTACTTLIADSPCMGGHKEGWWFAWLVDNQVCGVQFRLRAMLRMGGPFERQKADIVKLAEPAGV